MESVTPQQVRFGPVCGWVPERGPIIYKCYLLGGAENSFQPVIEFWDSAVELITPPNWEGARENYSMPTHLSSWFTRWSYVALGDLWLFHPNIVILTPDSWICREEWEKLPKYRCAKLVASNPRRLEAIFAAKGASTRYRVKGLNTYLNVIFT